MSSTTDCSLARRDDDVLWVVEAKGEQSESELLGLRGSDLGHSGPRPMSVDGTHMEGSVDFSLKPCSTGPIVEGRHLLCLCFRPNRMYTQFAVICHCVRSMRGRVVVLWSCELLMGL